MKFIALATTLILSSLHSIAQVSTPTIIEGNYSLQVIPGSVTVDGQSRLSFWDYTQTLDYNKDFEFIIFDRDFNIECRFNATGAREYVSIYDMDNDVVHGDVNLTQNFFNSDDLYEYVVQDETAFKVMSQDGTQVLSIPCPAGIGQMEYSYLAVMDEKHYVVIIGRGSVNNSSQPIPMTQHYTFFYQIDPNSATIRQVNMPIKVRVMPTVVPRSTPITVTLDGNDKSTHTVNVTATNGVNTMNIPMLPGNTSATIDTSRLSKGIYVVSVTDGEKTADSCKIVIR